MLSLAAAWVLFPAVLVVVAAGLGLALDRIVGRYLPGTLIMPLGMASAIAVARLVTTADATAELALPLLLLLALAGLALGRERLGDLWAERPALVAAGVVFLAVGAPAYLSLEPTFVGYLQLPDTSHQLAVAAFAPDGGTDWEKLPTSAYSEVLKQYIETEYPIAPQAALGVLAPLGVLDPAWLYHPFLAVLLAMAALSIYTLAGAIASRWLRAAVAFGGAGSALVYSFALQGSIKEIAALAMIATATAAGADSITSKRPARGLLAVFVPAVAMLGSIGPAAGAYLGPVLLAVVTVVVVRAIRDERRRELLAGLAAAVAALVLAAPILTGIERAYDLNDRALGSGNTSSASDIGNLAAPLVTEQAAGIWLSTDYRWEPRDSDVRTIQTWISWLIAALAAVGLVWAIVRRAWGPLLLFLALGPPSLVLFARGTDYADAKVFALLSSLSLVLALTGAACLTGLKRILGYAVAGVVLGLLVVSQALTYHDSHPAPYERYEELRDVNERLADTGPTLATEWDEFARYFLRDAEPYAEPTQRHGYRFDEFRDPNGRYDPDHRPSQKTPYDIDDLSNDYVQSVNSIVLRRSPVMSRPPANFERTYLGDYYEVWERGEGRVAEHLPLGPNILEPSAIPRCSEVRDLAESAREMSGVLVAPARPRMPVFLPGEAAPSKTWIQYVDYPGAVVLDSAGAVGPELTVPEGGEYRVWAEGSFGRPVTVRVNQAAIGEVEYELGNPGQYLPFGEVTVEPGDQEFRVEQAGGDLRPGNGGSLAGLRHLGPVVLSPPENEEPRVLERDPEDWRSLCGQRLDWIEILVPGSPSGA